MDSMNIAPFEGLHLSVAKVGLVIVDVLSMYFHLLLVRSSQKLPWVSLYRQ